MHPPLPILKFLRQTFARIMKHTGSFLQGAAMAVKRWRQQPAASALEAERLDRIRNPWKYLGKP